MTVPAYRLSARGEFRHTTERVLLEANFDDALDAAAFDTAESAGAGAVNHDAQTAHLVCIVATGASDRAIVRSHARPRAAAGSWRTTRISARFVGAILGQSKRLGLADDNDGAFFELDGETLYAVRRSSVTGSPVEVRIAQAQWNVEASLSVVLANEHLFEIREAWPTGDLEFCVDGSVVHRMSLDGSIDAPAWRRARLPLLLECVNTAGTASGGALHVAHASIVVGQEAQPASSHAADVRDASVTTSQTALVAIRPKATFGSVTNLSELRATRVSVQSSAEVLLEVIIGATLSGSFSSHAADSRAESTGAPGTITGGRVVAAIPVSGFTSLDLGETIRRLADASQQTLVVAARAITGTAAVAAALTWKETP